MDGSWRAWSHLQALTSSTTWRETAGKQGRKAGEEHQRVGPRVDGHLHTFMSTREVRCPLSSPTVQRPWAWTFYVTRCLKWKAPGASTTLASAGQRTLQKLSTGCAPKRTDAKGNSGGAQCIVCAHLRDKEQKWARGWCPRHPRPVQEWREGARGQTQPGHVVQTFKSYTCLVKNSNVRESKDGNDRMHRQHVRHSIGCVVLPGWHTASRTPGPRA